jgi:hypothetical protein
VPSGTSSASWCTCGTSLLICRKIAVLELIVLVCQPERRDAYITSAVIAAWR